MSYELKTTRIVLEAGNWRLDAEVDKYGAVHSLYPADNPRLDVRRFIGGNLVAVKEWLQQYGPVSLKAV